ncbi:helix-turn-helix domain-containing protein [Limimaricola cinnabarinus]|uniref:helix-turn-helix domain-containing protein n=1 Tax=Limimaricola cinnabarinus TaxID=1125964 RepID=UPI0024910DD8|nr:helix-turn-helix transcriptional regulator [Limimaricola cinnabarinus]
MTGAELRAKRKAAGLSQVQLAQAAGIGRGAVGYWEAKPALSRSGWACQRMFKVLGIRILPVNGHSMRARGDGVLPIWAAIERRAIEQARAAAEKREAQRLARLRVLCGAMTRKGLPCRLKSEPGRKRCKFHGGRSTGPRTAEGRARIAEAQRRRWAAYRAERQAHSQEERPE